MNRLCVVVFGALSAIVASATTVALEWDEILVTESKSNLISLGERKVMGYYGTGAGLLIQADRRAPLGSYECAGMVDIAGDGTSLNIECVITDPTGEQAYLTVVRAKSDTFAAGAGVYRYTGGTGAWADFRAECVYQVTYMPSKVHGVEVATCSGDVLPPPLR
jgi:hypothetical protein